MGYRITYENGVVKKETMPVRQIKWKKWGAAFAAAGLAVTLMVPRGRLWVRDLLLPGDEDITAAALEGMDALLATDMMPPGVPVATVGIGGAANAALLAAQILAVSDMEIAAKLDAKRIADAKVVLEKDAGVMDKL